jgi:uncharacterized protein (TIGR02246 family)
MKKIIQIFAAYVVVSMSSFANNLAAQDTESDMAALVKKYEDAYNNKDTAALRQLYTTDAVRVNPDGTMINGNEAIAAADAENFEANGSSALKITPARSVAESDGTITSTGTYSVTSAGNSFNGSYSITCIKQDGQWKIAKNVLSN